MQLNSGSSQGFVTEDSRPKHLFLRNQSRAIAAILLAAGCVQSDIPPQAINPTISEADFGADTRMLVRVTNDDDILAIMRISELHFIIVYNEQKVSRAQLDQRASEICQGFDRSLSEIRGFPSPPIPEDWPPFSQSFSFLCK